MISLRLLPLGAVVALESCHDPDLSDRPFKCGGGGAGYALSGANGSSETVMGGGGGGASFGMATLVELRGGARGGGGGGEFARRGRWRRRDRPHPHQRADRHVPDDHRHREPGRLDRQRRDALSRESRVR